MMEIKGKTESVEITLQTEAENGSETLENAETFLSALANYIEASLSLPTESGKMALSILTAYMIKASRMLGKILEDMDTLENADTEIMTENN